MSHKWNWCAHCLPQWAAISPPKQDLSVARFFIVISYDNRGSIRVFGSRLPCWLMCNSQFHNKSLNMTQKQWLTCWHVRKKVTLHLILPMDPLSRPSQCLSLFCVIPNQKMRHRKILFWWRYGCSLWQTVSTPISFVAHWHMLFVFWHSKSPPLCLMGTYQKKRHRNNRYWWRYWHLLLVTVVNSEQDILHSDGNHLHFFTF